MSNWETHIGWDYHNATKHSYWSIRQNAHHLDWENQPSPFKIYPTLQPLALPRELPTAGVPALEAVAASPVNRQGEVVPDLATLAALLYYSAGVTKKRSQAGGELYFRAAACAGALYPIEIYVVCGGMPGLQAGVYHFSPRDFSLRCLREGDYRGIVVDAAGNEPSLRTAPVILIHTAITWRSAWKYQARSYRYHFWDAGMVLTNLLAACAVHDLPTALVMGFADDPVNRLIGVDGEQEMSVALLPLGTTSTAPPPAPSALSHLKLDVSPLSRQAVDYPIVRQMHTASKLSPEEVSRWRGALTQRPAPFISGTVLDLKSLPEAERPDDSFESVIMRRASTRRFVHKMLPQASFMTMLDVATHAVPADFLQPDGPRLNDLYVNVHAVEGVLPGAYVFHWEDRTLELLKEGDFREKSSYLCLEQALGGDAGCTVFFMADLERIFQRYGNRGYRAVQMEASLIGGKLYVAAYALKHGATGLTFYDDDVTEFFSPHAQGKSAIFVMALGIAGQRPRF